VTKKQIKAIENILARESAKRIDGTPPGVHPSLENYYISDACVTIMFRQKPEGFPEGIQYDDLGRIFSENMESGNYVYSLTATTELVKEWKTQSKLWKKGLTTASGAVPVEITAHCEDGAIVTGRYDPRLLIDAVESIGTNSMIYIGKFRALNCNALLVYPKDWVDTGNSDMIALVLPIQ